MIVAINYADGVFRRKQRLNSLTASKIGKVDKVISYGKDDIDPRFAEENKEILSEKRGSGLWLWKPYFISKTLQGLQFGDYLVYSDSGILFLKRIKNLIDKLENSRQDVMLFNQPLLEVQWTNPYTFEYLECNNEETKFSNQVLGGILIIKKSEVSIRFINEWLELCKNKNLLAGPPTGKSNHFIAHREDQSLLSILSKKHNIKSFQDVTDYGRFPTQNLAYNRFLYIEKKEDSYNIDNVFFLHYRKENPYVYYLKYLIKNTLNHLGVLKR